MEREQCGQQGKNLRSRITTKILLNHYCKVTCWVILVVHVAAVSEASCVVRCRRITHLLIRLVRCLFPIVVVGQTSGEWDDGLMRSSSRITQEDLILSGGQAYASRGVYSNLIHDAERKRCRGWGVTLECDLKNKEKRGMVHRA